MNDFEEDINDWLGDMKKEEIEDENENERTAKIST